MDDWLEICALEEIAPLGARVLARKEGPAVAVFRTESDQVFALLDVCPHKGGPLSQGMVFGETVACPLHNWQIGLQDGCAQAPDVGCTTSFRTRLEGGKVYLSREELQTLGLQPAATAAVPRVIPLHAVSV